MNWIPISKPPSNSRKVLITDGRDISCAHYFKILYNSTTGEEIGPEWGNQWEKITNNYIDDENITHWAEIEELIKLLPKVGK